MKKSSVWLSRVITGILTLVLGASGTPWVNATVNEPNETGNVQETSKPGEMIIGFRPGLTDEDVTDFYDEYYAEYGLTKKKDLDRNKKSDDRPQKLAEAPDVVASDLMTLLSADPRVEYVEPNYVYATQVFPNDVRFEELWGLHNSGQTGGTVDVDIDAPEAWDIPLSTQNVLVAIIDTGIDVTHEDLAGNLWVNPNEIPDNGVDDDGNGYVDDMHGINAITGSGNPFDDNGHGTHVAGTIAAVRGNSVGVAGVSHNAKIIACKFLNSIGSGTAADATECIKYVNHLKNVLGQDIVITNNSWGGSGAGSQAIRDAFAGLDQPSMNPILHVTAAGNNNTNIEALPFFPASFPLNNILAVAAIDHNDLYGTFSNFGNVSVDVAGPGVNIVSTVPNGVCQLCNPTGYRALDGTSMASPHVAGIAALVRGRDPTMTAAGIKAQILNSVDTLTDLSKRTATDGRVNALRALTNGSGPVPPVIISTPETVLMVDRLYTYQPQASGTTPLVWSLITGPVGMTINPSNGLVSWTPPTEGNFTMTLEARNASGSDTQSFTLNVYEPPTVTSIPVTTAVVGQPYTYQASATGTQPITWTLVSGPTGMTITSSTGLVSWIPGNTGSVVVQIQANNQASSDTQTYTIAVIGPPTITSPPVTDGVPGQLYGYQPLASGTQPMTWSFLQNPEGMTIDSATGLITWIPATTGSFPVQIQVRNAAGSETQSWNVTVVGLLPPAIGSTPGLAGVVGQAYIYQATATGTQPITWSLVSGPVGMTIGANNGLVSWMPGVVGNHPVQIQATNGAGSNSQSFTINVTARPPTVESFSAGPNPILAGGSSTLTWATTGADTVSIDMGVGVGLTPNGSRSVSPTTTTTYTLTATGAGGTATSSVTVTVNNIAPPSGLVSVSGPSSINRGDNTSYTVTFTNTGNSTITGVQLSFIVPQNSLLKDVSPGNSVLIGSVAPGTSVSQTWNVRGDKEGSGTITGSALSGATNLDTATKVLTVFK